MNPRGPFATQSYPSFMPIPLGGGEGRKTYSVFIWEDEMTTDQFFKLYGLICLAAKCALDLSVSEEHFDKAGEMKVAAHKVFMAMVKPMDAFGFSQMYLQRTKAEKKYEALANCMSFNTAMNNVLSYIKELQA